MGTIFVTRLIVGNIMEVGMPIFKYKFAIYMEQRNSARNANIDDESAAISKSQVGKIVYEQPEKEAKLNPYSEQESFDDYNGIHIILIFLLFCG